jgi:beta-glucanase (GH16 family)
MTTRPKNTSTRLRRRGIAALAAVAAGIPLALVGAGTSQAQDASPASAPPAGDGWTRVWTDDFDGPAGQAIGGDWSHETGTGFGTGEIENMTDSTANTALDGNGNLAITPIRQGDGSWTSGRVTTNRNDFTAPAGGVLKVEASLQMPDVNDANGTGYWPAFWMLGEGLRQGGTWPDIGEIDIMEAINGRNSVFGTLHCGVNPGGPCNESTGLGSGEQACDGCRQGFHTYAIELDRSTSPEQLRWYRDGANYFTLNSNQVDQTTWNDATHHGFFIILNVAMGGGFPGAFGGATPNDATASGQPMRVDYVTVETRG